MSTGEAAQHVAGAATLNVIMCSPEYQSHACSGALSVYDCATNNSRDLLAAATRVWQGFLRLLVCLGTCPTKLVHASMLHAGVPQTGDGQKHFHNCVHPKLLGQNSSYAKREL